MFSSTFWHVLAENILLVELGQTIAFYEAKMLCLKGNLPHRSLRYHNGMVSTAVKPFCLKYWDFSWLLYTAMCLCYCRYSCLRPGAHQSSKAAFCKSAFAKSKLTFGKSAFVRSRFAFRQSIFASQKAMVWPSATSKLLSAKTCQNVLENIFAFC